ncbi:LytTR family DNA-binding domain-containing protein [uncultured Aquimarina sp.]|uniref:LytR/AlgR family response regulator transcription factor n=1 Tax=uncultured Aquimarina sp. TaxID=575652 RepID=UPI00262B949F|nr:response regulator transcription factor [uncultured Aquimarina sp.]
MDSINVLIVEDNPHESDPLVAVLKTHGYTIVGVATNLKEALHIFYNTTTIDVVILDVFLDKVPDGIAFAETINAVPNASKPFVFLTSATDRSIFERAKLTQPFSYLLKPFNELELLYAIEMAVERFYAQKDTFLSEDEDTVISETYLYIKKGKILKKVFLEDIIYIEVEEKYCNIVTPKEKFVILISLTKILNLLDDTMFSRTHRNYVVNMQKIEEIIPSDNLIVLSGNHHITLSEKYKSIIKRVRTLK